MSHCKPSGISLELDKVMTQNSMFLVSPLAYFSAISCNSKLQTRPLVREGATKIANRSCLNENLKEKEGLVAGPRWALDTKTDRPIAVVM
jgi:hypothetical protein